MNLLAIESSTDRISLALSRDGRIVTRELPGGAPRASEALVAEIGALLEAQGLSIRDLDAVAYDRGPGAFTSIRVGCAVAKAIALAGDLPVIGIPSLEALAAARPGAERLCCAIDARMGEVYVGRFVRSQAGLKVDGVFECVAPASYLLPDDDWLGVGTGFAVQEGALRARNAGRLSAVFAEDWPSAQALCELAIARLEAGERPDAADAAPLYVRDKVALTTREREQARG